jgi:hypothetical protein
MRRLVALAVVCDALQPRTPTATLCASRTRRAALGSLAAAAWWRAPARASAAEPPARPAVAVSPPFSKLLPVLEFGRSVGEARASVAAAASVEDLRKVEDRLLALLARRKVFTDVCVEYSRAVVFADGVDARAVAREQVRRQSACASAVKKLEAGQLGLAALVAKGARQRGGGVPADEEASALRAQLLADLGAAVRGVDRFLEPVPEADMRAVNTLLVQLRGADTDGDGTVSGAEYDALSPEVRQQIADLGAGG